MKPKTKLDANREDLRKERVRLFIESAKATKARRKPIKPRETFE